MSPNKEPAVNKKEWLLPVIVVLSLTSFLHSFSSRLRFLSIFVIFTDMHTYSVMRIKCDDCNAFYT